jgi:Insertion element 4 transposase N-terminal
VLSYLPDVVGASRTAESPVAVTPAGTVVMRAADLQVHGGTVTAGDTVPSAGELAVFCRPVVTAPAVARRDGTVLAGGWLPDFVRLGELERHLGGGVIEAIAGKALEAGRLRRRERRRLMSYPLVIRLMIAMALMPEASYCESLARLAGILADIPFALAWHVPAAKVVTDWRMLVPADVMEALFWQAAGPLISDDEPPAVLLAGMTVCAADGMLVNVADTPENRAMFGCAGTASQDGEGSAPFPQLRVVALTARAGRAMPGAILGRARAGEQTLLARLARRRPDLFAGRGDAAGGQPVAAGQPAEPAAQGVAGHADARRAPGQPGQAVPGRRDDHVLPHRAGPGAGGAGSRVNAGLPHPRRPQQHRAVQRLERRGAVTGALRGDPHPAGAGVPDRLDHVAGRPGDHGNGGALVHGQVPRPARLVVAGLAQDENLARDRRPQRFQVAAGNGVRDVHSFLLSFVAPAQGDEILRSSCNSLFAGALGVSSGLQRQGASQAGWVAPWPGRQWRHWMILAAARLRGRRTARHRGARATASGDRGASIGNCLRRRALPPSSTGGA